MTERSAGCTLKTEQRVNEEASYEKATVRKQKFRVNNNLAKRETKKCEPA